MIDTGNVAHLAPAWFVHTSQPVDATPSVSGGTVFVGDTGGTFYAIDQQSGAVRWSFSVTSPTNTCHAADRHAVSYGEINTSAAVATIGTAASPTVFFGGGATLYALDAATGACRWSQNLDPTNPTSGMEILASPVIDLAASPPEVIVGDDTNESPGPGIAEAGVQAFNARTGTLLWKYEPERNMVVHSLAATRSSFGPDGQTQACGDVWSSPALDTTVGNGGLVLFGTGNCPDAAVARANGDFSTTEGIFAIDALTGQRVWSFFEPPNLYANASPNEPDGGDDDFGSSPVVVRMSASHAGESRSMRRPSIHQHRQGAGGNGGSTSLVLEGSKSGYMYALDEATGKEVWHVQAAQPGQTGNALNGSIGGFIGGASLGRAQGRPTLFATSAIPGPFQGAGVNGTSTALDTSLASDPLRASSLHAIDAATGRVLWQQVLSTPSYASTTYVNGVVFAPGTTSFSVEAYDAGTGAPLWAFPVGAAVASGVSVVGSAVFFGAGISLAAGSPPIPPQADGVWSFALTSQLPPLPTPSVASVVGRVHPPAVAGL
ncbi:MAG: outer membrane protein assembly factor BamB family protein [Acidimicrobiales bacterium]